MSTSKMSLKQMNEIRKILTNKQASTAEKLVGVSSILGAAGYTLLPFDLILDAVPIFGTLDDAGVWIAAIFAILGTVTSNRKKARESVEALAAETDAARQALCAIYKHNYERAPTDEELDDFIEKVTKSA